MKTLKKNTKNGKTITFFDLPLHKKREIVLAAAKGSNDLQLELVKEYELKIKKQRSLSTSSSQII